MAYRFLHARATWVICTLFLIMAGSLYVPGSRIASAEELCVPAGFGIEKCSETSVVGVRTYVVETTHMQSCQKKGKSPHTFQQPVTFLETHEVTEYETVIKTYLLGNLSNVEQVRQEIDVVVGSETLNVGKCRKVKT